MSKFDYNSYASAQSKSTAPTNDRVKVGYFNSLKEDGDEAVVRFTYSSPSEFDLVTVHRVTMGGMWRNISCLRSPYEAVDKCPLCAKGEKVLSKFFVKLVEYLRDENGNVVARPVVWERPASFAKTLKDYFDEYGNLSDCIFKIKRHGARGCLQTSYEAIFANPAIYKPEIYVKDFSAFNDFDLSHHSYYDKSFDEINTFIATGSFPETPKEQHVVTQQPYVQQPYAQQVYTQYSEPQPQAYAQPTQVAQPQYNTQYNTQPTRPVYGATSTTNADGTPVNDPTANRPRRTYNY